MNNYTVESLRVMSDLEHIRNLYGMYIGENTDPRHLLVELIDNSVDEVKLNNGKIIVEVDTKTNTYKVTDNGRGIPIGMMESPSGDSKLSLEMLTRYSKSGGKFNKDGEDSGYKTSIGLHGVGMSVVTALSEYFKVKSQRDNEVAIVTYNKNKNNEQNTNDYNYYSTDKVLDDLYLESLSYSTDESTSGTVAEFRPDKNYFQDNVIPIDFIVDKCKILSCEINIELYIDKKLIDTKTTYRQLAELDDKKIILEGDIKVTDGSESLRVILGYSPTEVRYVMKTSCNLALTSSGGTHYKVVSQAIEETFKSWSTNYRQIELIDSDYRKGLFGFIAVELVHTSYSSQTKERLTVSVSSMSKLIEKFKIELYKLLDSHKDESLKILKSMELYRDRLNKLANSRDIKDLVKVNDSKDSSKVRRRSVVTSLYECTDPSSTDTEIYIVEGESAAGSATESRNLKKQAVLPVRGKVKNVTYLDIKTALANKEVLSIINAIGAGVGDKADPTKSRYGKIFLNADADPDGGHITALCLSVLVNLLPTIVKAGMVYVVEPPLYGYFLKGEKVYTSNIDDIPEDIRKSHKYFRYKGLGSMNPEDYGKACMHPDHRIAYQIEYPDDLDEFNRILGTSSGRRELLVSLGLYKSSTYTTDDSDFNTGGEFDESNS